MYCSYSTFSLFFNICFITLPSPRQQHIYRLHEGTLNITHIVITQHNENLTSTAFTHCVRHSGTRRINHGDETQEAELHSGEVRVVAVEVAEAWKRREISEVIVHNRLK
uniref:Uncharacterized protein n=1 Tax=Maylandia zebra TaxID=106582 RepID=A0A3P9DDW6_9CICH